MEPAIPIRGRVIVDRGAYATHGPARGDIVVFTPPPDAVSPRVTDLIKRVIGLPGETISSPSGQVIIDGQPLNEPWLPKGTLTTGVTTEHVPPNEYYVLGDNRGNSQDSRFFGPISSSLIVGRVIPGGCTVSGSPTPTGRG